MCISQNRKQIHSGSQKWSAPVLTFCSHCEGLTGTEIVWLLGQIIDNVMDFFGLSRRRRGFEPPWDYQHNKLPILGMLVG